MAESPLIPQYSLDSPTAPELDPNYISPSEHSTFPPSSSSTAPAYSGAVSPTLPSAPVRVPTPPASIQPVASSSSTSKPPPLPQPTPTPRPRNGPLLTPKRDLPVPEQIPGVLVNDTERHWQLRYHLADLCGIKGTARFPGSQPVSFDLHSLQLLETEDFWVCEKSDGVRVLVLIVATGFGQETYLIDRKENIYQNYYLTFPHQDGLEYNHSNTVLDAEYVIDVDPITGQHIPRLLVFDCLVLDSDNLMAKPLLKRYGRLKEFVMKPYDKVQKTLPAEVVAQQPFEVVLKKQELAYGIEAVFRDHVPALMHGNDGLIFTSAESPYTPGTDPKILKWKPPSENSIDFLLQLKFPPQRNNEAEPDFTAKPAFMLLMNHGHEGNHFWDIMEVDDETWEKWKASGEQYDDRVVEVVWDQHRNTWKMLRFRDDKREGNFKTVVTSIIKSIQHGVEAEQLVAHAGQIKKAWKAREAARKEAERRGRSGGGMPASNHYPPQGYPPQGQAGYSNGGGGGYAQNGYGGGGGGGGGGLRR
ncbi:mRNA guanylyltransferase [Sporobolomyces salmoneus]|uniref:mRNA guanylyltransferase n=1 Tax=Sporobolomyces salmoneus TaxID=183962 RepID=UPI0031724C13